jgi:hypothetical protein
MAEYCDSLQSKEERNREYKLCLSRGTILHLLDVSTHEKRAVASRSRVMLKIAEKLGFLTGTVVEVCKNHSPTAFLRPIVWVLSDSGGKIGKKSLQMVVIRRRF